MARDRFVANLAGEPPGRINCDMWVATLGEVYRGQVVQAGAHSCRIMDAARGDLVTVRAQEIIMAFEAPPGERISADVLAKIMDVLPQARDDARRLADLVRV